MADFNELNEEKSTDVVTGVEPAKKGKGKLIAGITAGVLVVGVGGGFAAYATSDYVKNQVKLTVSSPENYYAWVNEKNTEDFAKQISEQYRTALDEMKNGQKGSVTLKYEPTDSVKDMLSADIDDQPTIDIIKNINSISIGSAFDSKDNIVSGNAFIGLNDDKLATMDIAVDSTAMEVFFRIPELTEQWLNLEAEDTYGIDDDEAIASYQEAMKNPESVITPEELETEITKYANLWNECIADVELEKKADVAISDITVNYTVASVTIDEAKGNEIAEKFITAVKEDELLKSIVVDRLGVATADEYTTELDDVLAEIKENTDISDETVTLNTYIDPTGCIRGILFETSENNNAKFVVGKDGNEIRGEFSVSEDGEETFKGILTATENNKKYSGAFDMTADEETVSIEFTDLETVDDKKGYMNGVLTLVLPADAEVPPISVSFSSDGNSQQISAPIEIDGTDYGKITLDISSENGAEPVMPDKSGAFVINDNTDAELSDYVEQAKVEEFVKNIIIKIGFSEEIADETAKAVGEELYYDYSADFDYDDYDSDFSYDGDDWDDSDDFDDLDFDDDDWDDSDDFDDLDFDDDDWDDSDNANDYVDPYADDIVVAEKGQAYIFVIDNSFVASYMGMETDTLAYNATVADITGNGTYTVKVTANSDGFKNIAQDSKPDGIMVLGVEVDDMENIDNAVIEIKSVKIDGKEIDVNGDTYSENTDGILAGIVYSEGDDEYNIIDGASVGEWTDIEITFEVKGME